MAADYDAPRKNDDEESDSIEALKERSSSKTSTAIDVEDLDTADGFELAGGDLSAEGLEVVVLPPQADEFTCIECFLVKHQAQKARETIAGFVCVECA